MKRRFLAITAAALAFSILSSTAAFAQGWGKTDNKWFYYLDNNGRKLLSQLLKLNNDLFWLDADGVMAAEEWVQTEDGKWYYFQADGKAMKNGWKLIGEDYYYFLKSGVMARDALVPGGYRVGSDGKWVQ